MKRVPRIENMPQEYQDVLEEYAQAHGKRWRECLAKDFHTGQDERFHSRAGRHQGGLLRQIRNHPEWGPSVFKIINGEAL